MIPKIIHFVWLSGDPYPRLVQACLNSWRRHLPEYNLRFWTKESFDFNLYPFVREAYALQKWAFCADVIRLHALRNEGGLYLDSDVLFRASLPDEMLKCQLFTAVECHPGIVDNTDMNQYIDSHGNRIKNAPAVPGIGLQAAIVGAVPGHPLISRILDYYKKNHFVDLSGMLSTKCIAPSIYAGMAEEWGFRYQDEYQRLRDEIDIYPSSLFSSGLDMETSQAIAVHCCSGSWRAPRLAIWRRVLQRARYALLRALC